MTDTRSCPNTTILGDDRSVTSRVGSCQAPRRAGLGHRRLAALGLLAAVPLVAAACSSATPATTTTTSHPTVARHAGGLAGTVTSLSGSTLTIMAHGKARTISLTPSTAYHEGHSHLTRAALTLGTHVRISLVAGSSSTAKAVTVIPPTLSGTVTALSSGSITVRLASGASRSVTTSSATVYVEAGKTTNPAALKVGERVRIVAQTPRPTSLSASRVVIEAGG